MFTRLSNTHTVCLPRRRERERERELPSFVLGCLHQHISNVLRPAFFFFSLSLAFLFFSPDLLLQPTDAVRRQRR